MVAQVRGTERAAARAWRPSTSTPCAASPTSPSTGWARRARRSTRSTSTRCPTATPAPTCTSPSRPPATRCPRPSAERPGDLRAAMRAYSRGALLGARGNSGVILSQLVGALLRRIGQAGPERPLRRRSSPRGWRWPPMPPTPRWAVRSRAPSSAWPGPPPTPRPRLPTTTTLRLGAVVHLAAEAAREALARTPEQLPLLADAGVVDAGGRGLCVVLDAAESAITGQPQPDAGAAHGGARRSRSPGCPPTT